MIGAIVTGAIVYIGFTLFQNYFSKKEKALRAKEEKEKLQNSLNNDNNSSKSN